MSHSWMPLTTDTCVFVLRARTPRSTTPSPTITLPMSSSLGSNPVTVVPIVSVATKDPPGTTSCTEHRVSLVSLGPEHSSASRDCRDPDQLKVPAVLLHTVPPQDLAFLGASRAHRGAELVWFCSLVTVLSMPASGALRGKILPVPTCSFCIFLLHSLATTGYRLCRFELWGLQAAPTSLTLSVCSLSGTEDAQCTLPPDSLLQVLCFLVGSGIRGGPRFPSAPGSWCCWWGSSTSTFLPLPLGVRESPAHTDGLQPAPRAPSFLPVLGIRSPTVWGWLPGTQHPHGSQLRSPLPPRQGLVSPSNMLLINEEEGLSGFPWCL